MFFQKGMFMGDSDNVIDMRLQFATSGFAAMQRKAVQEYMDTPQCKTMRDFLTHCKAKELSDLTTPQKAELLACMGRVFDTLQLESERLLVQLGATDESSLSPADRIIYDASMKATVEREDHYP